jgi:hypothetical protein
MLLIIIITEDFMDFFKPKVKSHWRREDPELIYPEKLSKIVG